MHPRTLGTVGIALALALAAAPAAQAKKASKRSSSCKSSSQVWVSPCTVHETGDGDVIFNLVGHKLIPNTNYTIWAPELNTGCGATTLTGDGQNLGTGAVETSDFSGNLNVGVTATGCVAKSTSYPVELETGGSKQTYDSSLTVKAP